MSFVLEVRDLTVQVKDEIIVNKVSFSVKPGQCIGILGESGSGKSTLCKALMGLLDDSFLVTGEVRLKGQNLLALSPQERQKIRGDQLGMIMQNPMTAFDPLFRLEKQMLESLDVHTQLSKKEKYALCLKILEAMQIKEPREILKKYPHQLSGGTLQRIMIGITLMMDPVLILADEPTTAIDSLTQAEIMKEFEKIKENPQAGMIFVSHDLGVISKLADEVLVMYKGYVEQQGSLESILKTPVGAYTQSLVANKLKLMNRFNEVMEGQVLADEGRGKIS